MKSSSRVVVKFEQPEDSECVPIDASTILNWNSPSAKPLPDQPSTSQPYSFASIRNHLGTASVFQSVQTSLSTTVKLPIIKPLVNLPPLPPSTLVAFAPNTATNDGTSPQVPIPGQKVFLIVPPGTLQRSHLPNKPVGTLPIVSSQSTSLSSLPSKPSTSNSNAVPSSSQNETVNVKSNFSVNEESKVVSKNSDRKRESVRKSLRKIHESPLRDTSQRDTSYRARVHSPTEEEKNEQQQRFKELKERSKKRKRTIDGLNVPIFKDDSNSNEISDLDFKPYPKERPKVSRKMSKHKLKLERQKRVEKERLSESEYKREYERLRMANESAARRERMGSMVHLSASEKKKVILRENQREYRRLRMANEAAKRAAELKQGRLLAAKWRKTVQSRKPSNPNNAATADRSESEEVVVNVDIPSDLGELPLGYHSSDTEDDVESHSVQRSLGTPVEEIERRRAKGQIRPRLYRERVRQKRETINETAKVPVEGLQKREMTLRETSRKPKKKEDGQSLGQQTVTRQSPRLRKGTAD